VYYPQGSLTGLSLDLRIRHATGNAHSLDEVMERLYEDRYARGEGFTTADLLDLVGRAGDRDVRSFYDRYVDGREELPIETTLALAGLRVERKESDTPYLGVSTVPDSQAGIVVAAVGSGTAAEAAGVRVGDVLLSVGEVEVGADLQWGNRFIQIYAAREGDVLPLRVRRGGKEEILGASVRLQRQVQYDVTRDPAAGPLEREIFESLVRAE
jgi:predicted metalloprotease with PDZ domain